MNHLEGFPGYAFRTVAGILVFFLIFQPIALNAQTRRSRDTARERQEPPERRGPALPFSQQALEARADLEELQQKIPIGNISRAAYEAVIRSGDYIVGPGDLFAVVLDSGDDLDAREIPVGAGGDLLVPFVGPVPVAGKNLRDTYRAIQAAISSRFQKLDINVTLSRLRTFPVNVIGEVRFPGAYGVHGAEQVSELIIKAGGLVEEPRRNASMRNIQILRLENGQWQPTGQRADLMMWNLTGKEEYNPFLLDGEQVFVPTRGDSIHVSGAVRRPGNYEFAPTDRISTLLALGGGLRDHVVPHRGELLRLDPDREPMPQFVDLARALSGNPDADMRLRAGDKLYVWGEERWVSVEGEVRFPGPYPIGPGLTLRALLERVQIKPEASLEQASLIRRVEYDPKAATEEDVVLERLLNIPRNQRTDEEEALIALKTQQVSGRLPVDFAAVIAGIPHSDMPLQDGDIVRIPRFISSVRVSGAVRAPANIPYDTTATVMDYIALAGGFTDRAKRREVVVIQGSTGNPIRVERITRISPGDAIFVPDQPVAPGQGYRLFREVLTVSASIASLILTIQAIRR